MTKYSAVGSPEVVKRWLEEFAAETRADELILAGQIYDHTAQLGSFEIAAVVHAGSAIDHVLLNPVAAGRLMAAGVDREVRGWEKTSDHAPTWIELRDR